MTRDVRVIMTSIRRASFLKKDGSDGSNTGKSSAGVEVASSASVLWASVGSARRCGWHVVGRGTSVVGTSESTRARCSSAGSHGHGDWASGVASSRGGDCVDRGAGVDRAGGAGWAVGDGLGARGDGDVLGRVDGVGRQRVGARHGAGWARGHRLGARGDGEGRGRVSDVSGGGSSGEAGEESGGDE